MFYKELHVYLGKITINYNLLKKVYVKQDVPGSAAVKGMPSEV